VFDASPPSWAAIQFRTSTLARFARRSREKGRCGVVHQHLREDKWRGRQIGVEAGAGEDAAEHSDVHTVSLRLRQVAYQQPSVRITLHGPACRIGAEDCIFEPRRPKAVYPPQRLRYVYIRVSRITTGRLANISSGRKVQRSEIIEPGWQRRLCQFFTRDAIARFCLDRLTLPNDLLKVRLLEPAAGRGAFILPLIPRLVRACQSKGAGYRQLTKVIKAFEIDEDVARRLQLDCAATLRQFGVDRPSARRLAHEWIVGADFLDVEISPGFTHIVGNPPYIRWDAIPKRLIRSYRARFSSFRSRADLYVAFIEKSLSLLASDGQLAFLCPGNWTRNTYGAFVREALTKNGRLEAIIDLTDIDSFESAADAYPCFFVFRKGATGATEIVSAVTSSNGLAYRAKPIRRKFAPSSAPLLLTNDQTAQFVSKAVRTFPPLEAARCSVRVGSATGCNKVFLASDGPLPVEADRLLPFVNARSIRNAKIRWSGTRIINVFDRLGRPVDLEAFPMLRAYLLQHKTELQRRAKASRWNCWWRPIDVLHPEWYSSRKLLIADISSQAVIGLDDAGYCAGSGVYQIKSTGWPLEDLLVLLSGGILGTFVGALSQPSANGFSRFQKQHITKIPLPLWEEVTDDWKHQFRDARLSKDMNRAGRLIAKLYGCDADMLAANIARDWGALGKEA
jgi:adenine-specific DNA-methyltransferase